MIHEFGGEWTNLKLEVMRSYFGAYATALKYQPFQCWYIDAFAGSGERADRRLADESMESGLFGEDEEAVARAKDGSVRIALSIEPPFERYLFIDNSKDHIARLNQLSSDYPGRSIKVINGDANEKLGDLCEGTDWKRTRAAVFIDPYGMQVSWKTLERLANTNAVDVALLFPTGPLNRLLKRDGEIPPEWVKRIDDHLGPCDWRSSFYRRAVKTDLFDTVTETEKNVDIPGLQTFVRARLHEVFSYVHEIAVPLKNSKGSVLYDLFIICANPSAKAMALSKKLANGAIQAATEMKS